MILNGKEINVENLIESGNIHKKMHKIRENGLFLSDEEIELLDSFDIPYKSCTNIMQLVHMIDEVNEDLQYPELDQLASSLAEQNYYLNTNK